jgi:quinol monooxygenase YgiN
LRDALFNQTKENKMYAMTGKLTAQSGKRGALVEILLRASEVVAQLPGCRAYIVNMDVADKTCVWIFEVWDDKAAHDRSLTDERVRSLIAEAMPLMDGPPSGAELEVAGGRGIGR